MAKTFINGSDREKFDFLQQVMKTEYIEQEINTAEKQLLATEQDLSIVHDQVNDYLNEVRRCQQIYEEVVASGKQAELEKEVINAKNRVNKSILKKFDEKKSVLEEKVNNIKKLESELDEKYINFYIKNISTSRRK